MIVKLVVSFGYFNKKANKRISNVTVVLTSLVSCDHGAVEYWNENVVDLENNLCVKMPTGGNIWREKKTVTVH